MSNPDQDGSLPIGEKVRRLREGACLGLEQLAERAGLSAEELHRIESELISPALGTLMRICDGLGVRLGHFFEQGPRKAFSITRAADQTASTRFATKSGTNFGQEYCSLASEKRERVMEPFLITVNPPSDRDGKAIEVESRTHHAGEEFVFVLEGELEIQIGDQTFVLGPGDSMYYDSTVEHRVSHHGTGPCKTLAVIHLPRSQ